MCEIFDLKISYEELKSIVIETIKIHGDSFQFENILNTIARLAIKKEIVQNPYPPNYIGGILRLTRRDKGRVREVLQDLIGEEILMEGDHNNDAWPFLSLTDYGLKVIGNY